jgi:Ca2+-binding EF-hand superfamily protein
MRSRLKMKATREEFIKVFRIYDEDDSGMIDMEDL